MSRVQCFDKKYNNKYQNIHNLPTMSVLTDEEIQSRHKSLDFTYKDYLLLKKNLENIRIKQYTFLEQIGQGAFAQVYKAINEDTNKYVAIKVLNLRSIESEQSIRIKAIRKRLVKEESKIMMRFNSPSLLKCYECFENRDLKLMVIEYCENGSLLEKIETVKKIPQYEAVSILKQIINGVGECHKQKIIHRDLKADNILCNNGEYKIADFGFSKELRISNEDELSRNTCLGTMTTMAPEVLKRQDYGLKADIWSVGVIFFQMLFGQCPFKSNTSAQMITEIMSSTLLQRKEYKGVRPSPEANKFIREVLVVDINKRLGWRELLEHDLLKVKPETLSETFNRRVETKMRDEELESIERDFIKTGANDLSMMNANISSEFKSEDQKCESQLKFDSLTPQKKEEEIYKKTEQKPVYETKSVQVKQEINKPYEQPKEQRRSADEWDFLSEKPSKLDVHQSINQNRPNEPSRQKPNEPSRQKPNQQRQTFKKLKPDEVKNIIKLINKQDAQIYKWASRIHIECLKTECIFTNVIKPIEKHNLLDLGNRRNIELMYLIATRCMNNISPISFEYQKQKNNPIIQDIHYEVSKLYQDVVNTWVKYSSMLTSKQNQAFVMVRDWFSKKLSKQGMKMKDKYLTGVENMTEFRPEGYEQKKLKPSKIKQQDLKDYEKQQQIDFTQDYINQVIKEMKQNNLVKDARNYLIHYRDICRIEASDLTNRPFSEHLALILM